MQLKLKVLGVKSMDKKIENAIFHIKRDYEAILKYMMTCLNNKLDYSSYMGVMPFFCMYVLEGYNYLQKNHLINADCIEQQDLNKLEVCRSKGVKLHSGFKQKSFNSINDFNRDEYIKFYKAAFPKSKTRLLPFVDNYFICCVDEFPIGNYHLYSKKVFDMEVGSYIPDVSKRVYDLAYLLANFSSRIVMAIDQRFGKDMIDTHTVKMDFKYIDLNMAYDYSNFRIKCAPPILMAFLDVLCVLNSYQKVFTVINEDSIFDVKVKYTILFHAILSAKDIVEYCERSKIDIQMDEVLKNHIKYLDKTYVKNELRKFCMHYDFPETTWQNDSFTEMFEKVFGKPFKEISHELSFALENLAERLQEYLIVNKL